MTTGIQWVDKSDLHWQGKAPLWGDMTVPVLMIHYADFYPHWCGYIKHPRDGLPPQDRRRAYEKFTTESITFFGSSGPVISLMAWNLAGELTTPHPQALGWYWLGFDLPEGIDRDVAEIRLEAFARSFYKGFYADKTGTESEDE